MHNSTNLWSSNDGCLMFSFTSKFYDGQSLPCVQYLVSIALIEAARDHIRDITGERDCLPYLKIKWPNDIYYGEKKMGGVLCNSMYIEGAYITTIGVGFNVRNKEPSICMCELFEEAIAIRVCVLIYSLRWCCDNVSCRYLEKSYWLHFLFNSKD